MFEFAFVIAALNLLGIMTWIHHNYSGKIENKQKEAEREYAKEVAKICKESYKSILKEFISSSPTAPDEFLDSMEKFWIEATSAQFKKLDILTKASKPNIYLHDTILAFTISVILLLLTGLFPYFDLTIYALAPLIISIIAIIIGVIRFRQMLNALK